MKYAACILLVMWITTVSAAESLPCVVALDGIRGNVPGYINEPGAKQPRSHVAIYACVRLHRVCLLLQGGKVVSGDSASAVSVKTKSIIFGVTQTLRTKSRPYCIFAGLYPEVGGDKFWAYRTFTPDGTWIGEEIDDQSTKPKSSQELYAKLSENFQAFQVKMHQLLSEPSFRDGENGYRKGEEP